MNNEIRYILAVMHQVIDHSVPDFNSGSKLIIMFAFLSFFMQEIITIFLKSVDIKTIDQVFLTPLVHIAQFALAIAGLYMIHHNYKKKKTK
jgi:hypothetical protein